MKASLATYHADRIMPQTHMLKSIAVLGGIALCFTGIGILIGVPMIYYGASPKKGAGAYEGNCPKCEKSVHTARDVPGFDCPHCKVRLVVNQEGEQQRWSLLD